VEERRLAFDMHDTSDILDPLLSIADLYFKRSYSPALHGSTSKIRPYGLNYGVDLDGIWPAGSRLAFQFEPGRHRVRETWRALGLPGPDRTVVQDLRSPPRPSKDPRAIFLTRVWDPDDSANRPPERREERRLISIRRAECVERLQRRFGSRFTGGLQPSAYAIRNWPSLVVDPSLCKRARFLAELDRHDIGIATDGLYGSIGWKFAEYVAKARAIVTEPLRYSVIGPMVQGKNYLTFEDAEQCVDRVQQLFDDPALRSDMMQANFDYFNEYALPEQLIGHAIFSNA
jgi:hypothetical protein